MSAARPPSFVGQLLLLWELRLVSALNRGTRRGHLTGLLAFAVTSAPAVGVAFASHAVFAWPPVASSPEWTRFLLTLCCFVTSAVWTTWPLLSAGVDDESELSRFAAFPLSPFRLLCASVVASLFVPRALVFHAPLLGAAAALLPGAGPLAAISGAGLFALYALMNAAWSRAALHGVLNVLRQERSGQIMGGSLAGVVVFAALLPPIDTSWLQAVGGGIGVLDLRVIRDAGLALGRVPSGFLGEGWLRLSEGGSALPHAAGLLVSGALALFVAHRLLLRFHRHASRGVVSPRAPKDRDPFARVRSPFATLALREAIDLWHNPRARILACVPFLLTVLLRLLAGRDLFVFLWGGAADAWLLGGLCLYAAVVMGSTFSQNAFGYDGHGMALWLAAPRPLGEVLAAKNAVHGAAAVALAAVTAGFYSAYLHPVSASELAAAVLAASGVVPMLLCAGNFLSLFYPVKFHAALNRRDRLPFRASLFGVAAAAAASAPSGLWLRHLGTVRPGWVTAAILGALALGFAGLYAASFPLAARLLDRRRELLLSRVTRS